jgi:hypothetical protein
MNTKTKLPYLMAMGLIAIGLMSCKKADDTTSIKKALSTTPENVSTLALGPWNRVFTDDFNDNNSFNNWVKANRADYNSSNCIYDPNVPVTGNYDSKNVLVLTATKNGNSYKSGHVKSNFSFKPNVNEEYRTSASIKFIAIDGTTWKDFTHTYGAWPAFWTVQESSWPVNGEIDIVEAYSFGNSAKYASNLFYGTSSGNNQLGNTCEKPYSVSAGWHLYDEYWKNQNGTVTVTIQLDGVTVATYTNAINGNLQLQNFGPHNVIFNLNVGSNSNIGIFNNSQINLFSKTMMWVDYVTVDKRTL